MDSIQIGSEAEIIQPLDSLSRLCEKALHLHSSKYLEEAGKLASFLLPLESFPTLWSKEGEYDENKTLDLFSRLKKIEPVAIETPVEYQITAQGCFTLIGNGTSLGVIRQQDVEIRAFGPQKTPSDFGIDGVGMDGWVRTRALPQCWMEVKIEPSRLNLKFVGLETGSIFLAFYVKAKSCQIKDVTCYPKSLQRFTAETDLVQFDRLGCQISSLKKVEIIPLAGEGCFWDSDFLLNIEIHSCAPQISISFKNC